MKYTCDNRTKLICILAIVLNIIQAILYPILYEGYRPAFWLLVIGSGFISILFERQIDYTICMFLNGTNIIVAMSVVLFYILMFIFWIFLYPKMFFTILFAFLLEELINKFLFVLKIKKSNNN